jgi:hypothetical protein
LRPLQQAVELNPGHFLPWLELGLCQEALGLAAAAEKSLTQARDLNRHNAAAVQALSHLCSRGTSERLRDWWRRLKK